MLRPSFKTASTRHRLLHREVVTICLSLLFLLPALSCPAAAQQSVTDSLSARLASMTKDEDRVDILNELSWELRHNDPGTAQKYAREARNLARKLSYESGLAWAQRNEAVVHYIEGNYKDALGQNYEALLIFERLGEDEGIAASYINIGLVHWRLLNHSEALEFFFNALAKTRQPLLTATAYANIGLVYTEKGEHDSAMVNIRNALEIHKESGDRLGISTQYNNIGWIYELQKDWDTALAYYRRCQLIREELNDTRRIASIYTSIGSVLREKKQFDQALKYFFRALKLNREIGEKKQIEEVYQDIARTYAALDDFTNAYRYHRKFSEMRDSVLVQSMALEIAKLESSFEMEKNQQEIQYLREANELQQSFNYVSTAAIVLLLITTVVVFIGYREKTKAHRKLETMQLQLIAQEKLASLGQLTAGIAHEIQNPLNFVNNFAGVTADLAREAQQEIAAGGPDSREQSVRLKETLQDIESSATKVCEHGQRASSIVRGMVAHSHQESGEKTATDLNALLDETIGIAYQGKRAQSSRIDIEFVKHFDSHLPQLRVFAPDVRRVFLNILGNAFDALDDKKNKEGDDFSPVVTVSTSTHKEGVAVTIRDNGPGIPDAVLTKIFQPFFTTKDPGKGTGLGLHMCHDIVVDLHAGKLEVNSNPGEFTEFSIILPLD